MKSESVLNATAGSGLASPPAPAPSSSTGMSSPASLSPEQAQAVLAARRRALGTAPTSDERVTPSDYLPQASPSPSVRPASQRASIPPAPPAQNPEREEYLRNLPSLRRQWAAEKSWRESRVPELHAAAVDQVLADAGPAWLAEYRELVGKLDTGFMSALVGPFGFGKTQLAVCVAREAANRGMSVRYYRTADYFVEHRSCYGDPTRSEREFLDLHANLGLLILDEAHQRGHTPYEDQQLNNMLDRRYGRRRPTLLISNESVETFTRQIGLAVVDRMNQVGGIVVCDGEGWRDHRVSP